MIHNDSMLWELVNTSEDGEHEMMALLFLLPTAWKPWLHPSESAGEMQPSLWQVSSFTLQTAKLMWTACPTSSLRVPDAPPPICSSES